VSDVGGSSVEIIGLPQANRDLQRWAKQLGPDVEQRARPFGESLRSQVAGQVPVLTGTLASSVEVLDEHDGIGVSIGADVDYAGWIEFGGSRGRPLIPDGRYLYPTAAAAEDEFIHLASDTAEDTARRFPWSTPST
jgi:phage gpG-like protein